jgi:hypothetical protein
LAMQSGLPENTSDELKNSADCPTNPARQSVAIAELQTDVAAQVRVKMRPETVQEYAEAMQNEDDLGPVVVFRDKDGTLRLADGLHRVEAARAQGKTEVAAEVREGDERAAFLYAAGANVRHGLKATTADRKKVAALFLKDPEWGKWSDREISRRCGLGQDGKTVAKLRRKLSAEFPQMDSGSTAEIPQKRKVTRGGTDYEMKTSSIGKAGEQEGLGGAENVSGTTPETNTQLEPPPALSPDMPATSAATTQTVVTSGGGIQPGPVLSGAPAKLAASRDWAKDKFDLAYLVDSGLLFQINHELLHPLGLALAVTERDGRKKLSLKDGRADPATMGLSPSLEEEGRRKLTRFMSEFGQAQMTRAQNRDQARH